MAAFRTKDEEIFALRARVADLEAELAEWQAHAADEVAAECTHDGVAELRIRIGCEPRVARLLIAMAKKPERFFTQPAILRAMGSHEDAVWTNATVAITHARQALRGVGLADTLRNLRGQGYRFERAGADFVNSVISLAPAVESRPVWPPEGYNPAVGAQSL